ncbi:MAG TPA: DNA methyltransferase [Candidatus Saccharimonadales bacterium]|nr:DNA methyltransferase [Candidatus Saccharimonadales bacterium]
MIALTKNGGPSPSTRGRTRTVTLHIEPDRKLFQNEFVHLHYGNSLNFYDFWPSPTVIVSDGGYGVLGFDGDTSDHLGLPDWYEPHIKAWAAKATPQTTLWFWNSEIGWAAVHPVLERYGFRYINANFWNKGKAHIAGNVNTQKIRRFPVVTEICVQYSFEAKLGGLSLKEWMLNEWKRSGLPVRKTNEACGVADAATRKYFDQGHLWYPPPPSKFQMLVDYANTHGDSNRRPYFSVDGSSSLTADDWVRMRYKFRCPHGFTNVWERHALHCEERIKAPNGKAAHLNQKPLDLLKLIIQASSDDGDVVWEPFGGLFSASLAAWKCGRTAYAAEIDSTYFQLGMRRFTEPIPLLLNL